MGAVFINLTGLERALSVLLYFLGKEPPRERRTLRDGFQTRLSLPAPVPGQLV